MDDGLLTVVETPAFLRAAADIGLSEDQRMAMVSHIAAHPDDGVLIVGSGGVRKFRFPGIGRGKSGGYRVVYVYFSASIPLFLLGVLEKSDRENFTPAEVAQMRKMTGMIKNAYRRRPQ